MTGAHGALQRFDETWPAKQIPLKFAAAQSNQGLELCVRFHPFGNGLQTHVVGEIKNSLGDGSRISVFVHVQDERSIDLQHMDGQRLEVRQ